MSKILAHLYEMHLNARGHGDILTKAHYRRIYSMYGKTPHDLAA